MALWNRANVVARAYRDTYRELCQLHDQLRGIGSALATANASDDIVMAGIALTVPNFNLAALSDGSEYIASRKHIAVESDVLGADRAWSQARVRLCDNPDADVDDLIAA